jgi:hypothetical protein
MILSSFMIFYSRSLTRDEGLDGSFPSKSFILGAPSIA